MITCASLALLLAFQIAAAAVPVNEASAMIDTNASDESDLSLRDSDDMAQHHGISSPVRRQYLKYGLLGKRQDGKLRRGFERTLVSP